MERAGHHDKRTMAPRCIRGMRLTVRRVLEAMASYPDQAQLFAEYPELDPEDLRQALTFAAASLDEKTLELRTG
jgi:uncharacterized protein (DUF433 family)